MALVLLNSHKSKSKRAVKVGGNSRCSKINLRNVNHALLPKYLCGQWFVFLAQEMLEVSPNAGTPRFKTSVVFMIYY